METFFTSLALCEGNSPVTGEFPPQRQVTRSFDVFFDLRLNKRLSIQSIGRWFETPPRSLWRHCNDDPASHGHQLGHEMQHRSGKVTKSMQCGAVETRSHYCDVIMSAMASQITGVSIVYSTVCSGTDLRKHQIPVSLAFRRGIHRWPMNSPHKGLVTRKTFPFENIIMSFFPKSS